MPRLLYLDFDGVLHPTTGKDLFSRMHLLEEALIGKDCQIIISSSWRFHHPFEYLQSLLPESLRGQVAGVTGGAFVGRWPRHSEILIDVSKLSGRWRALDGSWIEFPKGCPALIRCNPNSGMGSKDSAERRSWLATKQP
jgi:hypothetical protein